MRLNIDNQDSDLAYRTTCDQIGTNTNAQFDRAEGPIVRCKQNWTKNGEEDRQVIFEAFYGMHSRIYKRTFDPLNKNARLLLTKHQFHLKRTDIMHQ